LIAVFTVVLAQTCTGMLPTRGLDREWLRNDRLYARDELIETTTTTRTYRRSRPDGRRSTVTASCTGSGKAALLRERIVEQDVSLPVLLGAGESRVVDGTAIRRIDAPKDGTANARWFSVAGPLPRIYGVRTGAGVVEMRVPAANGGVDIYRVRLRKPDPPAPPPPPQQAPQAQVVTVEVPASALEAQIGVLQKLYEQVLHEKRVMEDSIHALEQAVASARDSAALAGARTARDSAPRSEPVVDERLLTMLAVDVLTRRDELDEALALLDGMRTQLTEFERATGHVHPGASRVAERITAVTKACDKARRLSREGQCAASPRARPYTVADIIGLLQGGVEPESVAARVVYECVSFDMSAENVRALRAVGGTPGLERAIAGACRAPEMKR
jgi:hypothetical protein